MNSKVARAYRAASESERRKLDLMVNLHLREVIHSRKPIQAAMAEISRNAQKQGLTREFLQSCIGASV